MERFREGFLESKGMLPSIGFLTGSEGASGGPSVNVYRGIKPGEGGCDHAFSRGFTTFDIHIGALFPNTLPLDKLLDRRIDQAKQTGTNVVVLDLGAGVGNLTRQALTEPEVMPFSRRKLGRKGETNLRFYSITDATRQAEHLQRTPFSEADARGNEKIQATDIKYSITSSQTVRKLMDELDEGAIDVATASNFMSYLPLPVFEGVTRDVIDFLPSGGEFRVFGYAIFAGLRLSIDDGRAEEDYPVTFRNPYDTRSTISADDLREAGQKLLDDDKVPDNEINKAIRFIYDSIFASANYPERLQEAMVEDVDKTIRTFSPREVLNYALTEALKTAEPHVRALEIRRAKDAILDRIQKEYSGNITIEREVYDLISEDDPFSWERLDGFVIKKL